MRVIERKQRVHGTPEKAKRDREEAIQLKRKRMESFEDACREFEGVPKAVGGMRDFHRDVESYPDDDSESNGSSEFELMDEYQLLSGCGKRKRLRKAVDSEEEDEEEDESSAEE
jgi:hypothetical protein